MEKRFFLFLLGTLVIISVVFFTTGCKDSYYDEVFTTGNFKNILLIREQAELIEQWLRWKKENFIPEMMVDHGVEMWIITEDDREIFPFLVPAEDDGLVKYYPFFLVFCLNGGPSKIEEIPIGNTEGIEEWGPLFPDDIFSYEESLERLVAVIKKCDPQRIAIDRGRTSDLEKALGGYASRLVSGKDLRDRWIEYRTPQQVEAYKTIVDITHDILPEAFSNRAITPDVTTTSDVDWWVKQKLHGLGFQDVFGPTVMVWRSMEENKKYGDPDKIFNINIPPYCGTNTVIRRGDVLSCDFGIRYLGLTTDIQQVGYVLREGETDVPEGLKEAMKRGNRLQDILAAEWKVGRTGNEVLFATLEKAKAEELRPEVYCHSMGSYVYRYGLKGGVFSTRGASFGPSVGSEGYFDEEGNQRPTRRGELVFNYNTAYAMELDVTYALPEWGGQDIRIVLEEKAVLTKDGIIFPGRRQTEFHIIR
jgi:Xaa-Pro aminopeptidase